MRYLEVHLALFASEYHQNRDCGRVGAPDACRKWLGGSFISNGTWKRILPEMFHDGCRLAVLLVLVLVLVLVLGSLLQ